MKTFGQLRKETSTLHLEFLLLEISIASTFLEIAQTTRNVGTRTRNLHNASVAYETVLRLKPRVITTEAQDEDLKDKLLLLKQQIDLLT